MRLVLESAPPNLRATVRNRVEQYREDAQRFRRYGAEPLAVLLETVANDLEADANASDDELLTLNEAARDSGYTADHLGRLVRDGKLANRGRRHCPRVARADLPRKVAKHSVTPESSKEVARRVVDHLRKAG